MTTPDFTPSPQLYPFESRWFHGAAGRVHYIDEGRGQPILLLHGNPTWSFLYRDLIRHLRARFRCIAVDYLGFGLSERPAAFGYSPAEHTVVIAALIRHLDLSDLIIMGHDWGGPIGLAAATEDAGRVSGLVLGNTWFWPMGLAGRIFSGIMSSGPMQRRILERNYFIEQWLPRGVMRKLSDQEMDHYRGVQPTAELRAGIAQFPRQITAASPWLTELERRVTSRLATKPTLITYPMRDTGFPAKKTLPRFRATFRDIEIVELERAKHFFLEDESESVAAAISARFGPRSGPAHQVAPTIPTSAAPRGASNPG